MPSSVMEEDMLKLREAKFLTAEISHRLPAQRQAIPSPQPGESKVFMSHFLRGLGFPMDPFLRGLMFYYGLEFHDLAPESILHISSFIVVCEAFLRIKPHFGLWLKIFNVKPKIVVGQQEECGGAMVGKIANVTWLEGSFVETIKGWQSGWFYITEPRDPEWAAAPEFRSGIPTRLTSWKESGLSWGDSGELTRLQACIQKLVDKKLKLVNIVQVMLIRRILPCQRRGFSMWEFDSAHHQTLSGLFDTTYEDAWKVLFKGAEAPASATEDRGFSSQRPADEVSDFVLYGTLVFHSLTLCGI